MLFRSLAERLNGARYRVAQAQAGIAEAQRRTAEAQAQTDRIASLLANRAATIYKGATTGTPLKATNVKQVNELGIRSKYAAAAAERDAARQRRDATWSKIRRRLIEEHETSWFGVDSGALGKSYEQAVREADEIADRIYANADAVVRREELGRQRDLLIARINQKQERAALLTQQQADLQSRWVGVWQACGFVPLDPDAMRPWVSDHETVCETVAKREEIIVESDLLRQQSQTFEARLRSACEDRKSTRLNSSHIPLSRMPSSA